MSRRSSFASTRDVTLEERKRALAAKNQLSKGDNEPERIIEGFQILDTLARDSKDRPLLFCSILRDLIQLVIIHLKNTRFSIVKTALDSISLWSSLCTNDFEGVALSLWQTLVECSTSSKRTMASAAECTMMTIVMNCRRAPNLFSSLLSYFCTSTHSMARLSVMKCIGEAVRCWDDDYIAGKNGDIVSIVLSGVKDRSGDVRDSSRIVLCYLYGRSLHPPLSSSELTDSEVFAILNRLISPSQQSLISNAALELIRSDLRDFHSRFFASSPSFLSLPIRWPENARSPTPEKSRSSSPSPQPLRVRGLASTPIKAPQRITLSPPTSPLSVKAMHPFTSRLPSAEPRVTVEMLEAQERQRVAMLAQLPWTNQLEVLRGMKNQLEAWGKAHPSAALSPGEVCESLFHTPVEGVMENLGKVVASSVTRVTSLGVEVMHGVVTLVLTEESIGLLVSVLLEGVKSILSQSFMNAENANSRLVVEMVNHLISFRNAALNEQFVFLFTHSIQFAGNYTISLLLRFLITLVSVQPNVLFTKPELLRNVIDCCYRCILNNSTVLLRLVRELISTLSNANSQETAACIQSLSTSKRIVFIQFAETSKLDETFISSWKTKRNSTQIEPESTQMDEVTLSKPTHFLNGSKIGTHIPSKRVESGNSDLSTTTEDIEEPSAPRPISVIPMQRRGVAILTPKKVGSQVASHNDTAFTRLRLGRGGKQELDQVVDLLSKHQFCTLVAFNQLWNVRSPLMEEHPLLFSYWATLLSQQDQIALMQQLLSELLLLSKNNENIISDDVFRCLLVFSQIMMLVPPKMMVEAKQLKRLLLCTIRSEKCSFRWIGYRIIKFMTTLLNENRVEDYLRPLSLRERLVLSHISLS